MRIKNIAFYEFKTFLEFKFLKNNFNLKVLNEEEKDKLLLSKSNPFEDDTYSPFDNSSYWIEITKLSLTNFNKNLEYKVPFNKLVQINDFKNFTINSSVIEYENNFFEGYYSSSEEFKDRDNFVIRHPKVEDYNNFYSNKEFYKNFLSRCENKFKNDYTYVITFHIASDLLIDFEFFQYGKQNYVSDPILFIKNWEQSHYIKNSKYLFPIREMIIDVCEKLKEKNINNYFITPDITREITQLELDRNASLSWGNYDSSGLGL